MAIRPTVFAAETVTAIAVSVPTIGVGEALLLAADSNRGVAQLFNNGANTIFIGPTGVTIATGFPILAGASESIEGQFALFAVVAAATEEMRVLALLDN